MSDRDAIRRAAQVPLLWGRGDYSLGYSISQHILALIDEADPDGEFVVLSKEEIEKLIEGNEHIRGSMRFEPRPKFGKLLVKWLRGWWHCV